MNRPTPTIIEADGDDAFGSLARDAFLRRLSLSGDDVVVLPTGNTPKPFYDALKGHRPQFVYQQLDEYAGIADASDPRLFSNWLTRDVLDAVGIDLRMTFDSAANPERECFEMAAALKANPVTVAVLGLGGNGHVGFNEPGSDFAAGVRVVDLTPETLAQNNAYWRCDDLPGRAFTLGIADLRKARETILLVRGAHKAEILARAFTGAVTPDVPASYLQRQPNVTIVADGPALSAWTR